MPSYLAAHIPRESQNQSVFNLGTFGSGQASSRGVPPTACNFPDRQKCVRQSQCAQDDYHDDDVVGNAKQTSRQRELQKCSQARLRTMGTPVYKCRKPGRLIWFPRLCRDDRIYLHARTMNRYKPDYCSQRDDDDMATGIGARERNQSGRAKRAGWPKANR